MKSQKLESRVQSSRQGASQRMHRVRGAMTTLMFVLLLGMAGAVPAWAVCGDGTLDVGEDCDLGVAGNGAADVCCTTDCELRAIDHLCRAAAGDCDVDDYCDGTTPTCPTAAGVNLAPAGTATQISDLAPDTTAELAIDGNTSGEFIEGSVTHTDSGGMDIDRWWQLDLGVDADIFEVRVWNRIDCCSDRLSNFYLLVSDDPFLSDVLADNLAQPGVEAYFNPGLPAVPTVIPVHRSGRYLRVVISGTDELSLAEVEVFARSDEKADTSCRAAVGDCDVEEFCDGITDDCPTDEKHSALHECRPGVGECDVTEFCDGVGTACPADGFQPVDEVCGGESSCAPEGHCSGSGTDCVRPDIEGRLCNLSNAQPCHLGTCEDTAGYAFVGFTASVAGAVSTHLVHGWTFEPTGAGSPTIDFAGFPADLEGEINLRSDAEIVSGAIELTEPASGFDAGAAWATQVQPVAGGFDTTFSVQILTAESATVGDGMAFVVQRDFDGTFAIGGGGQYLGYGGSRFVEGVAVEIDTYPTDLEPGIPHISVQSVLGGYLSADHDASLGHVSVPDFLDEEIHTVRVLYVAGAPGTLSVFVDGSLTPDVSVALDLGAFAFDAPVCSGPFVAEPRDTCLEAGAATLSLAQGEKDKFSASWKGLPELTREQLSDPTIDTEYRVCVYDAGGVVLDSRVRAGRGCGPKNKPCWKETKSGYLFKDPDADDDGISSLLASGGAAGKSKAQAKGAGFELNLSPDPLVGPVIAQIVQMDSGLCLSSSFAPETISKNEDAKFKAKYK